MLLDMNCQNAIIIKFVVWMHGLTNGPIELNRALK